MQGVRYRCHGGPAVLEIAELERPVPRPGEALVRVLAGAVNRLDVEQRRGPAVIGGHELPHVPGMDICGEVVAVGEGVDTAIVGDRIVVNPRVPCGRCAACAIGHDGSCRQRIVVGGNAPGGYAELCTVPTSQLYRLPAGYDPIHAAALPTTYSLAWRSLFSVGELRVGETVVIHAAGSGVSTAAIQLAALAGARVIATARSATKLTAAEKLGAEVLLAGDGDELTVGILEATGGRGAEMVLDHTGQALFGASLRCLAQQGRLVICGATTGAVAEIDLSLLFRKGATVRGADGYSAREFASMVDFCMGRRIEPVIDSVVGLRDLVDAHERIEAGAVIGKIVFQP